MGTSYDEDVVVWAREQAALLRARTWSKLDVDNIAEEIDSVAWAEEREFANHVASLIAELLKWKLQPAFRCAFRRKSIEQKRNGIGRLIRDTPSLAQSLRDQDWIELPWGDASIDVMNETGCEPFASAPLWSAEQILDPYFFPD